MKKYNYFILAYNAMDYFNNWFDFDQFQNTELRFIDNGKQNAPDKLKQHVIHQTEKNIGCSGGWNLICDIGFNYFGFDKIIIGQEDARISEDIFEALLEYCSPSLICGTYNNSFEFSTYAIHKDTFNKVGRFDENFLFAGCEDNDYKHRCKLNGIEVGTLDVSHHFNCSIANNINVVPSRSITHNAEYIKRKWNDYTYTVPFNGDSVNKYTDYFIEVHGNEPNWPSENEFMRFKKNMGEVI
jgi:hypothetical protein